LVLSGSAFNSLACAFQAACSVAVSVGWTGDFRCVSSSDLHPSLKVIYPTLVVVLVETQRSMTDICEISSSNASKIAGLDACASTLRHLSYVSIHSTMHTESESQRSRVSRSQDGQVEHRLENRILEVK